MRASSRRCSGRVAGKGEAQICRALAESRRSSLHGRQEFQALALGDGQLSGICVSGRPGNSSSPPLISLVPISRLWLRFDIRYARGASTAVAPAQWAARRNPATVSRSRLLRRHILGASVGLSPSQPRDGFSGLRRGWSPSSPPRRFYLRCRTSLCGGMITRIS